MPLSDEMKCTRLAVLEANIDDMNPELFPYVSSAIFGAGARDVWLTPIVMKHGRPAQTLSVLCDPSLRDQIIQLIVRETTTFGVRTYEVERFEVDRAIETVETEIGQIEVKVAIDATGAVIQRSPEHRSCAAAAKRTGLPLGEVYRLAIAASAKMSR